MFRAATLEEATEKNGVFISPRGATVIDLIGRRETEDEGPLAFLVRSPPGSPLKAHFHSADQFQVFLEGRAWIGRHGVRVGSVHYADGYTPYGPILPFEDEGHTYATLRPYWSYDVHWVPEEIALAKGRSGRNLTGETAPAEERVPGLRDIFVEPDGVAAREFVAGPDEAVPLLGGHGYYIVLDGELICRDHSYPFGSCLWTTPSDPPELRSGPTGAVVAMLTYADRDYS